MRKLIALILSTCLGSICFGNVPSVIYGVNKSPFKFIYITADCYPYKPHLIVMLQDRPSAGIWLEQLMCVDVYVSAYLPNAFNSDMGEKMCGPTKVPPEEPGKTMYYNVYDRNLCEFESR